MEKNISDPPTVSDNQSKEDTKKCSACQSDISKNASICPHCRSKVKGGCNFVGVLVFFGTILFIVFALSGCTSSSSTPTSTSHDNASMAYVQAENFVKLSLKSPSTAKFPFFGEGKETTTDTYIVDSYVDSQNGFGAMIRSNFSITLQFIGGDPADQHNWKVLSFTVNGKDVLNP
jgi:hypothetical protein